MQFRFLALVASAALLSASVAHAEDAVVPDEFDQPQSVGACDAYGTGFAKLPGTNTCARVCGHLRYEKRFSNRGNSSGGQTVLDFETRSD